MKLSKVAGLTALAVLAIGQAKAEGPKDLPEGGLGFGFEARAERLLAGLDRGRLPVEAHPNEHPAPRAAEEGLFLRVIAPVRVRAPMERPPG